MQPGAMEPFLSSLVLGNGCASVYVRVCVCVCVCVGGWVVGWVGECVYVSAWQRGKREVWCSYDAMWRWAPETKSVCVCACE